MMFQNPKKRASRRGWPIHAYVGANGGGKTAAMVWDTIPSLLAGRAVLSTVRLLDFENPRPCDDEECDHPEHDGLGAHGQVKHLAAHPLWVPFTDWQQLLDAEHTDVLMDEVTGVASSRESMSMPGVVGNVLNQLRRSDLVVRWTAPNWRRADIIIRECTQAATFCRGFMPKRVEAEDGQELAWSQRRLFKWKTYDANDFDDFQQGKREQLEAWLTDWHYGPKSPVFDAYDTYDSVMSIGTVSDSGACYRCGGQRPRPKCSCPPGAVSAVAVAGEGVAEQPDRLPLRSVGQVLQELGAGEDQHHVESAGVGPRGLSR
ncbi:hypothetical protein EFK50_01385 [Nocardioides marmoriginsengisoli]|uniref:Zona occludens toxin N-terminal domain-containing protein n=1 Tax=Nocardioides marmoriginsengisoli TaxID=661483 RepID=A0A3N0CQW6_9ACTN|nr:hypothetical protein [Nocardioides marmoriginsengisoli]RNL65729.1 hypothetical protein EFK50_01385 [Nocardioides marmoriginsengisoli]